MSAATRKSGQCLCGAVRFAAEPMGWLNGCHCTECQRWGGGPFMAVPCKLASFEGPVSRYRSSDVAERGFCATCGTHLFFNPLGAEVYGVPLGLFDDATDLPFAAEFFIDQKPESYAFAGERKLLTIIADRAAVAVQNAALFETLEHTFTTTIEAFVTALEEKDRYTAGHSERVAEYARVTAEELGLSAMCATRT